ncbi:MAG: hypothetical protein KDD24_07135 [Flavobacteriales bacterium]|nr:hypothetical protein [Flavobacteriales bacterium]MCB9174608.1 hypothetical protein [Flavobacteriales bacterium]
MKKIVVKYSKLSVELKKAIRQKLEEEDVKFFSFPYQGGMEEGFLYETPGDEVNYLVILDTEKKTKYKPTEDDDDEDDDDFDDAVGEDLKGVDADDDDFKDDDVEDDFDDDDSDDDEIADEEDDSDDDDR